MGSSDFSSVAEIVPQISYDIIGRVIPGTVVLFSLTVGIMGPTQALGYFDKLIIHPAPPLSGWAVMAFVLAAYVLACLLDGIWQVPTCIRLFRSSPSKPDPEDPVPELKFERINLRAPEAGAWFTKLYAEANQAHVLIIGWFLVAVLNLYFLVSRFSPERLWLEID